MNFDGTIHLSEDPTRIPATMRVAEGRVAIDCDGETIGDWLATEVQLDHRPEGIVLHVEGESLILNPHDRYGFSDAVEAEVENVPTKRGLFRRSKAPGEGKAKKRAEKTAPTKTHTDTDPAESGKRQKRSRRRRKGGSTSAPEPMSGTLEAATPTRPVPTVSKSASVLEQAAQARGTSWVEKPAQPMQTPVDPFEQEREGPPSDTPSRKRNLPPVEPPTPFGGDDDGPTLREPKPRHESDPRRPPSRGRLSDAVQEADAVQRIPGRANSLSDAVRAAREEPVLSGFREPAEPEAKEKPFDLTTEIFGEEEVPEPKRGFLKRLGDRWLDVPLAYRRAVLGVAIVVLLWLLIPAVVATVLVLAGLVSCLVGGAGLADPSYTRRLPSNLSEARLLIGGAIMLVVGVLIGLPTL